MKYLDAFLNSFLPGPEFYYLPYTIILIFFTTTVAVWFVANYFKQALVKVSINDKFRTKIVRGFMIIAFIWSCFSLAIGKLGILDSKVSAGSFIPVVIIIPCVVVLILVRTKIVTAILDEMPDALLIRAGMFRLFFEPIAYLLYLEDHIPIEMTLQGYNPEMMVAISAPVLIALFFNDDVKKYNVAIIWNFIGLLSLGLFVWMILSLPPDPGRYYVFERPYLIMSSFPFILYPALYVPIAFMLHIFSIKQLWRDKQNPIKYDISYLQPR
jgi:hypothetical protein